MYAKTLANFWTWSLRGTLDSVQQTGNNVASTAWKLGVNVEAIGRALIVAGILLACIAVVVAIGFIVYFMLTVKQPRLWLPSTTIVTYGYVASWTQRADDLVATIEQALRNSEKSAMVGSWADTGVGGTANAWRTFLPTDAGGKKRFVKDLGAYVRLKDAINSVNKGTSPSACDNPKPAKMRYCEDECLSKMMDALYLIHGYDSEADRARLTKFISDVDALAAQTKSGAIQSTRSHDVIFGVWKDMTPQQIANHPFPEEAAAYSKSSDEDDEASKRVDLLQDAEVALQELAVHVGPLLQEMTQLYGSRRKVSQEMLQRDDLGMLLKHAPLLVWLQTFGYACKKYWWDGIVCIWESDKKCSRDAFYDTFNLKFANKMWSYLVTIPLQKYSKQLSKRALVETYADPFTAMKRGWQKFERFVRNLFWYIGFFLTHLELTFALILMFGLANIVWMVLATLTIPGVRYLAWAAYWYTGALKDILYHLMFMAFYISKGATAMALEFTVRLVSGGYLSTEFLSGSSECGPQLGTWHARAPGNDYVTPPVGCMFPCPTGFSASDGSWICTKDPAWRPGLCPQQQIHRILRENGKGVGRLATLDGASRYLSVADLRNTNKQSATVRMELEAHAKRMGFVESCMTDPKLTAFNQYAESLCMHNDTLSSPASRSVCKAAFCTRESASPNALCDKLDDAESDLDLDPNRNMAYVILLVTVVLVIICMAVLTTSM